MTVDRSKSAPAHTPPSTPPEPHIQPITDSKEMPVSRHLTALEHPAKGDDLRGTPIQGAQCRFDPELHTGPDAFQTESPEERATRETVAAEVCASCPLRRECLALALRTLPEHGVWAGFTTAEIATMRRDARHLSEVA